MELNNATVIVTGTSSGIGRALVEVLAGAGARVWATARRCHSIADLEPRGVSITELDVRDDASVRRAVDRIGQVNILINNAGYGLYGAVEEVSDSELLEQFDTNFFGPWRLCRAVLPGMRARGSGVIVNISSFAGRAPFANGGPYRASKYALEALSGTLHFEVSHFGIRVIDAQLGNVATRFGESMKLARASTADGPYADMRRSVDKAFPNMCPTAMQADRVASEIVAEIAKDTGPYRIVLGEDAARIIDKAAEGDGVYERFVVEDLKFDWHRSAKER
jgi:NAD(P)-dependent dehydrogenase (short-subunit alcohol dehydrogenase family)